MIVVAIIGVLVAIAIPTFTGAVAKAEEATEVANARSLYAQGMVNVIAGETYTQADYEAGKKVEEIYGNKRYTFKYVYRNIDGERTGLYYVDVHAVDENDKSVTVYHHYTNDPVSLKNEGYVDLSKVVIDGKKET